MFIIYAHPGSLDIESVILVNQSGDYYNTLKSWIGESFFSDWKLCWRASRDGLAASTFHSNCDYKKPTVTIVKVGQYLFGGYTNDSWEGEIMETTYFPPIFQIFSIGAIKPNKTSPVAGVDS